MGREEGKGKGERKANIKIKPDLATSVLSNLSIWEMKAEA